MNELLTSALQHAEQGWPVFFLGRSKRPVANCRPCRNASFGHDPAVCPCLTCHGFYAASLDPDRIAAMHAAVPGGLLAIRTGRPLVVVDIDPRNGGRLDPDLMPPTYAVATGNDGWHLYYRHPGGTVPSRGLPGHPGVDIKADGGYVVAPPSRHPMTGRPYRRAGHRPVNEMARPLIEVIRAGLGPQRPAPTVTPRPSGGAISSPAALLAAHLAAVGRAPRGRRRTTLYGAARGVARMVAAGALDHATAVEALTAAGLAAEQSPRQIHAAITGGFRDEQAAA